MFCNAKSQKPLDRPGFPYPRQGNIKRRKAISRRHLIKKHYTDFHTSESRDMAHAIKRYINETPKYHRESEEFLDEIRSKIFYLHEYNKELTKVKSKYPRSRELDLLLVRYIELECEILYDRLGLTRSYESYVENRVLRTLMIVFHDAFNNGEISPKSITNLSARAIVKLMYIIKSEYRSEKKLINNIVVKMQDKMSLFPEIEALKGKNIPFPLDTMLCDANVLRVYKYFTTSDYETDDDSCSNCSILPTFEESNDIPDVSSDTVDVTLSVTQDFPEFESKFAVQKSLSADVGVKNICTVEILDDDDENDGEVSHFAYLTHVVESRVRPTKKQSKSNKAFSHRPIMCFNSEDIKPDVKVDLDASEVKDTKDSLMNAIIVLDDDEDDDVIAISPLYPTSKECKPSASTSNITVIKSDMQSEVVILDSDDDLMHDAVHPKEEQFIKKSETPSDIFQKSETPSEGDRFTTTPSDTCSESGDIESSPWFRARNVALQKFTEIFKKTSDSKPQIVNRQGNTSVVAHREAPVPVQDPCFSFQKKSTDEIDSLQNLQGPKKIPGNGPRAPLETNEKRNSSKSSRYSDVHKNDFRLQGRDLLLADDMFEHSLKRESNNTTPSDISESQQDRKFLPTEGREIPAALPQLSLPSDKCDLIIKTSPGLSDKNLSPNVNTEQSSMFADEYNQLVGLLRSFEDGSKNVPVRFPPCLKDGGPLINDVLQSDGCNFHVAKPQIIQTKSQASKIFDITKCSSNVPHVNDRLSQVPSINRHEFRLENKLIVPHSEHLAARDVTLQREQPKAAPEKRNSKVSKANQECVLDLVPFITPCELRQETSSSAQFIGDYLVLQKEKLLIPPDDTSLKDVASKDDNSEECHAIYSKSREPTNENASLDVIDESFVDSLTKRNFGSLDHPLNKSQDVERMQDFAEHSFLGSDGQGTSLCQKETDDLQYRKKSPLEEIYEKYREEIQEATVESDLHTQKLVQIHKPSNVIIVEKGRSAHTKEASAPEISEPVQDPKFESTGSVLDERTICMKHRQENGTSERIETENPNEEINIVTFENKCKGINLGFAEKQSCQILEENQVQSENCELASENLANKRLEYVIDHSSNLEGTEFMKANSQESARNWEHVDADVKKLKIVGKDEALPIEDTVPRNRKTIEENVANVCEPVDTEHRISQHRQEIGTSERIETENQYEEINIVTFENKCEGIDLGFAGKHSYQISEENQVQSENCELARENLANKRREYVIDNSSNLEGTEFMKDNSQESARNWEHVRADVSKLKIVGKDEAFPIEDAVPGNRETIEENIANVCEPVDTEHHISQHRQENGTTERIKTEISNEEMNIVTFENKWEGIDLGFAEKQSYQISEENQVQSENCELARENLANKRREYVIDHSSNLEGTAFMKDNSQESARNWEHVDADVSKLKIVGKDEAFPIEDTVPGNRETFEENIAKVCEPVDTEHHISQKDSTVIETGDVPSKLKPIGHVADHHSQTITSTEELIEKTTAGAHCASENDTVKSNEFVEKFAQEYHVHDQVQEKFEEYPLTDLMAKHNQCSQFEIVELDRADQAENSEEASEITARFQKEIDEYSFERDTKTSNLTANSKETEETTSNGQEQEVSGDDSSTQLDTSRISVEDANKITENTERVAEIIEDKLVSKKLPGIENEAQVCGKPSEVKENDCRNLNASVNCNIREEDNRSRNLDEVIIKEKHDAQKIQESLEECHLEDINKCKETAIINAPELRQYQHSEEIVEDHLIDETLDPIGTTEASNLSTIADNYGIEESVIENVATESAEENRSIKPLENEEFATSICAENNECERRTDVELRTAFCPESLQKNEESLEECHLEDINECKETAKINAPELRQYQHSEDIVEDHLIDETLDSIGMTETSNLSTIADNYEIEESVIENVASDSTEENRAKKPLENEEFATSFCAENNECERRTDVELRTAFCPELLQKTEESLEECHLEDINECKETAKINAPELRQYQHSEEIVEDHLIDETLDPIGTTETSNLSTITANYEIEESVIENVASDSTEENRAKKPLENEKFATSICAENNECERRTDVELRTAFCPESLQKNEESLEECHLEDINECKETAKINAPELRQYQHSEEIVEDHFIDETLDPIGTTETSNLSTIAANYEIEESVIENVASDSAEENRAKKPLENEEFANECERRTDVELRTAFCPESLQKNEESLEECHPEDINECKETAKINALELRQYQHSEEIVEDRFIDETQDPIGTTETSNLSTIAANYEIEESVIENVASDSAEENRAKKPLENEEFATSICAENNECERRTDVELRTAFCPESLQKNECVTEDIEPFPFNEMRVENCEEANEKNGLEVEDETTYNIQTETVVATAENLETEPQLEILKGNPDRLFEVFSEAKENDLKTNLEQNGNQEVQEHSNVDPDIIQNHVPEVHHFFEHSELIDHQEVEIETSLNLDLQDPENHDKQGNGSSAEATQIHLGSRYFPHIGGGTVPLSNVSEPEIIPGNMDTNFVAEQISTNTSIEPTPVYCDSTTPPLALKYVPFPKIVENRLALLACVAADQLGLPVESESETLPVITSPSKCQVRRKRKPSKAHLKRKDETDNTCPVVTKQSPRKKPIRKTTNMNDENKRITRSSANKLQFKEESKYKPADFLSTHNSKLPTPKNNIYTQRILEVNVTSEDSNDSEGNLLIDDGSDAQIPEKKTLTVYEEETLEEDLILDYGIKSAAVKSVCISIPDGCHDYSNDSYQILEQIEQMEDKLSHRDVQPYSAIIQPENDSEVPIEEKTNTPEETVAPIFKTICDMKIVVPNVPRPDVNLSPVQNKTNHSIEMILSKPSKLVEEPLNLKIIPPFTTDRTLVSLPSNRSLKGTDGYKEATGVSPSLFDNNQGTREIIISKDVVINTPKVNEELIVESIEEKRSIQQNEGTSASKERPFKTKAAMKLYEQFILNPYVMIEKLPDSFAIRKQIPTRSKSCELSAEALSKSNRRLSVDTTKMKEGEDNADISPVKDLHHLSKYPTRLAQKELRAKLTDDVETEILTTQGVKIAAYKSSVKRKSRKSAKKEDEHLENFGLENAYHQLSGAPVMVAADDLVDFSRNSENTGELMKGLTVQSLSQPSEESKANSTSASNKGSDLHIEENKMTGTEGNSSNIFTEILNSNQENLLPVQRLELENNEQNLSECSQIIVPDILDGKTKEHVQPTIEVIVSSEDATTTVKKGLLIGPLVTEDTQPSEESKADSTGASNKGGDLHIEGNKMKGTEGNSSNIATEILNSNQENLLPVQRLELENNEQNLSECSQLIVPDILDGKTKEHVQPTIEVIVSSEDATTTVKKGLLIGPLVTEDKIKEQISDDAKETDSLDVNPVTGFAERLRTQKVTIDNSNIKANVAVRLVESFGEFSSSGNINSLTPQREGESKDNSLPIVESEKTKNQRIADEKVKDWKPSDEKEIMPETKSQIVSEATAVPSTPIINFKKRKLLMRHLMDIKNEEISTMATKVGMEEVLTSAKPVAGTQKSCHSIEKDRNIVVPNVAIIVTDEQAKEPETPPRKEYINTLELSDSTADGYNANKTGPAFKEKNRFEKDLGKIDIAPEHVDANNLKTLEMNDRAVEERESLSIIESKTRRNRIKSTEKDLRSIPSQKNIATKQHKELNTSQVEPEISLHSLNRSVENASLTTVSEVKSNENRLLQTDRSPANASLTTVSEVESNENRLLDFSCSLEHPGISSEQTAVIEQETKPSGNESCRDVTSNNQNKPESEKGITPVQKEECVEVQFGTQKNHSRKKRKFQNSKSYATHETSKTVAETLTKPDASTEALNEENASVVEKCKPSDVIPQKQPKQKQTENKERVDGNKDSKAGSEKQRKSKGKYEEKTVKIKDSKKKESSYSKIPGTKDKYVSKEYKHDKYKKGNREKYKRFNEEAAITRSKYNYHKDEMLKLKNAKDSKCKEGTDSYRKQPEPAKFVEQVEAKVHHEKGKVANEHKSKRDHRDHSHSRCSERESDSSRGSGRDNRSTSNESNSDNNYKERKHKGKTEDRERRCKGNNTSKSEVVKCDKGLLEKDQPTKGENKFKEKSVDKYVKLSEKDEKRSMKQETDARSLSSYKEKELIAAENVENSFQKPKQIEATIVSQSDKVEGNDRDKSSAGYNDTKKDGSTKHEPSQIVQLDPSRDDLKEHFTEETYISKKHRIVLEKKHELKSKTEVKENYDKSRSKRKKTFQNAEDNIVKKNRSEIKENVSLADERSFKEKIHLDKETPQEMPAKDLLPIKSISGIPSSQKEVKLKKMGIDAIINILKAKEDFVESEKVQKVQLLADNVDVSMLKQKLQQKMSEVMQNESIKTIMSTKLDLRKSSDPSDKSEKFIKEELPAIQNEVKIDEVNQNNEKVRSKEDGKFKIKSGGLGQTVDCEVDATVLPDNESSSNSKKISDKIMSLDEKIDTAPDKFVKEEIRPSQNGVTDVCDLIKHKEEKIQFNEDPVSDTTQAKSYEVKEALAYEVDSTVPVDNNEIDSKKNTEIMLPEDVSVIETDHTLDEIVETGHCDLIKHKEEKIQINEDLISDTTQAKSYEVKEAMAYEVDSKVPVDNSEIDFNTEKLMLPEDVSVKKIDHTLDERVETESEKFLKVEVTALKEGSKDDCDLIKYKKDKGRCKLNSVGGKINLMFDELNETMACEVDENIPQDNESSSKNDSEGIMPTENMPVKEIVGLTSYETVETAPEEFVKEVPTIQEQVKEIMAHEVDEKMPQDNNERSSKKDTENKPIESASVIEIDLTLDEQGERESERFLKAEESAIQKETRNKTDKNDLIRHEKEKICKEDFTDDKIKEKSDEVKKTMTCGVGSKEPQDYNEIKSKKDAEGIMSTENILDENVESEPEKFVIEVPNIQEGFNLIQFPKEKRRIGEDLVDEKIKVSSMKFLVYEIDAPDNDYTGSKNDPLVENLPVTQIDQSCVDQLETVPEKLVHDDTMQKRIETDYDIGNLKTERRRCKEYSIGYKIIHNINSKEDHSAENVPVTGIDQIRVEKMKMIPDNLVKQESMQKTIKDDYDLGKLKIEKRRCKKDSVVDEINVQSNEIKKILDCGIDSKILLDNNDVKSGKDTEKILSAKKLAVTEIDTTLKKEVETVPEKFVLDVGRKSKRKTEKRKRNVSEEIIVVKSTALNKPQSDVLSDTVDGPKIKTTEQIVDLITKSKHGKSNDSIKSSEMSEACGKNDVRIVDPMILDNCEMREVASANASVLGKIEDTDQISFLPHRHLEQQIELSCDRTSVTPVEIGDKKVGLHEVVSAEICEESKGIEKQETTITKLLDSSEVTETVELLESSQETIVAELSDKNVQNLEDPLLSGTSTMPIDLRNNYMQVVSDEVGGIAAAEIRDESKATKHRETTSPNSHYENETAGNMKPQRQSVILDGQKEEHGTPDPVLPNLMTKPHEIASTEVICKDVLSKHTESSELKPFMSAVDTCQVNLTDGKSLPTVLDVDVLLSKEAGPLEDNSFSTSEVKDVKVLSKEVPDLSNVSIEADAVTETTKHKRKANFEESDQRKIRIVDPENGEETIDNREDSSCSTDPSIAEPIASLTENTLKETLMTEQSDEINTEPKYLDPLSKSASRLKSPLELQNTMKETYGTGIYHSKKNSTEPKPEYSLLNVEHDTQSILQTQNTDKQEQNASLFINDTTSLVETHTTNSDTRPFEIALPQHVDDLPFAESKYSEHEVQSTKNTFVNNSVKNTRCNCDQMHDFYKEKFPARTDNHISKGPALRNKFTMFQDTTSLPGKGLHCSNVLGQKLENVIDKLYLANQILTSESCTISGGTYDLPCTSSSVTFNSQTIPEMSICSITADASVPCVMTSVDMEEKLLQTMKGISPRLINIKVPVSDDYPSITTSPPSTYTSNSITDVGLGSLVLNYPKQNDLRVSGAITCSNYTVPSTSASLPQFTSCSTSTLPIKNPIACALSNLLHHSDIFAIDANEQILPCVSSAEADQLLTSLVTAQSNGSVTLPGVVYSDGTAEGSSDSNSKSESASSDSKNCLFFNSSDATIPDLSLSLQDISPGKICIGSSQSLDLISPRSLAMGRVTSGSDDFINEVQVNTSTIEKQDSTKNREFEAGFDEISCYEEPDSIGDHTYTVGGPLLGGKHEEKNILSSVSTSFKDKPLEFSLNDNQFEELPFTNDLSSAIDDVVNNIVLLAGQKTSSLTNYDDLSEIECVGLTDSNITTADFDKDYDDTSDSHEDIDAKVPEFTINNWQSLSSDSTNQKVVVQHIEQCPGPSFEHLSQKDLVNSYNHLRNPSPDDNSLNDDISKPISPLPKIGQTLAEEKKRKSAVLFDKLKSKRPKRTFNIPSEPTPKETPKLEESFPVRRHSRTRVSCSTKNSNTFSPNNQKDKPVATSKDKPKILPKSCKPGSPTGTNNTDDLLDINKFLRIRPKTDLLKPEALKLQDKSPINNPTPPNEISKPEALKLHEKSPINSPLPGKEIKKLEVPKVSEMKSSEVSTPPPQLLVEQKSSEDKPMTPDVAKSPINSPLPGKEINKVEVPKVSQMKSSEVSTPPPQLLVEEKSSEDKPMTPDVAYTDAYDLVKLRKRTCRQKYTDDNSDDGLEKLPVLNPQEVKNKDKIYEKLTVHCKTTKRKSSGTIEEYSDKSGKKQKVAQTEHDELFDRLKSEGWTNKAFHEKYSTDDRLLKLSKHEARYETDRKRVETPARRKDCETSDQNYSRSSSRNSSYQEKGYNSSYDRRSQYSSSGGGFSSSVSSGFHNSKVRYERGSYPNHHADYVRSGEREHYTRQRKSSTDYAHSSSYSKYHSRDLRGRRSPHSRQVSSTGRLSNERMNDLLTKAKKCFKSSQETSNSRDDDKYSWWESVNPVIENMYGMSGDALPRFTSTPPSKNYYDRKGS